VIKPSKREKGRISEDIAVNFLLENGMEIIERNFTWSGGEIDIIARDGETLVFVEVRSLIGDRVAPVETVGTQKRRKLVRSALYYLTKEDIYGKVECRFDFLGIRMENGEPLIEHIKNAIILM